ncbi:MAG: hypothetical protein M1817_005756 [Caeruleum heppii]|nr:MAG: hypothetical protein M1817_005756 [Caeruleum heppii]
MQEQSSGPRKHIILLCFIHGFKGGDDTFGTFPSHLRALVSHALPHVDVRAVTYPKFETRGELGACVAAFREWLQNKVIDLEVEAGTPSPTIDPSVRTILVGHSMGGIVAAETVLSVLSDVPISPEAPSNITSTTDHPPLCPSPNDPSTSAPMFPSIIGILAFDTPYLGISPGVVAHGAEGHYDTATTALTQLSGLAGGLGIWGGEKAASSTTSSNAAAEAGTEALKSTSDTKANKFSTHVITNSPSTEMKSPSALADNSSTSGPAAAPGWARWGKIAMYAGAASAVAAGGAAAYLKRETLTSGWTWVGSHLEFVGCLARGEELRQRIGKIVELQREGRLAGFANCYTVLGRGAVKKEGLSERVLGRERTFCNLPREGSELRRCFTGLVNDKAGDEAGAHMTMFYPRDNPGFYAMSEQGKELIVTWASAVMAPPR